MVDVFVLQVDTGELYPVVVGSRSETYVHISCSGVSVVCTHTTHTYHVYNGASPSHLSQVEKEESTSSFLPLHIRLKHFA